MFQISSKSGEIGDANNPETVQIKVPKGVLSIKFCSDSSNNKKGFYASIKSTKG